MNVLVIGATWGQEREMTVSAEGHYAVELVQLNGSTRVRYVASYYVIYQCQCAPSGKHGVWTWVGISPPSLLRGNTVHFPYLT